MLDVVRWCSVFLFVAVVSGCVKSESVVCADGFVCPAGSVCVTRLDDSNVCAHPEDVEACNAQDEGAACGIGRRCYAVKGGLLCNDASCGNSFVDFRSSDFPLDEQCDDGNTVSGDGCSADCTSTEQCGNHVTDLGEGETCDDGNTLSHDGCTSVCGNEAPYWLRWSPPIARTDMAVAYDARRGRVVMFGGRGGDISALAPLSDTWEWNGHWEPRPSSVPAPAPRQAATMTYDVARGEIVLFGGIGLSLFADTHVWTGGAWSERVVTGPSARRGAAMAYDVVGRRAVLFGGSSMTTVFDDTWEWDGSAWTELVLSARPPGTGTPSMAYDPVSDTMLLAASGGTWELRRGDSGGWRHLFDAPSSTTSLVFDPVSSTVVATTIDPPSGDLRLYRRGPSGWILDAAATLAGVGNAVTVPDVLGRGLVVLSRGANDLVVAEWNGTGWAVIGSSAGLGTRVTLALDTRRRRAIVIEYGGTGTMLTFDANGFTTLSPATPLPPRSFAMAAYDEVRDRVVVFGGRDIANNPLDDTWEWDGQTWAEVSPPSRPPAATRGAMEYDRSSRKIVLVGGAAQTNTWLWDGVSWQSFDSPPELHGRTDHALAYDPIRQRVVLFGGASSAVEQNDIWTLEPTGWVEQHPAFTLPAPRTDASLAWDAGRRRLVLYGGQNQSENLLFNDAWEWDGVRWYAVSPLTPIPTSVGHAACTAFDGGGIIVVAGNDAYPRQLVWRGTTNFETCALPFDADNDEAIGCEDSDCWPACRPLCPPGAPCDMALPPYCGDQQCESAESGLTCSADCPAPASHCGNAVCEGEATTCPGDCPP